MKSAKELEDEYYKKNPGKRPLMRRLADNRKAAAKEKAKYASIYREEFNKQRAVSLKARAKQEAIDKFRPTRKQKMDSFANAIGNLGGAPATKKKTTTPAKKRKQPKYTIIGGKAYLVGGQTQPQKTKKKKTSKKSKDTWDLSGLDNFNFDF